MTQTEARQWLEAEIDRLERAPSLNGCSMTEEWQEQLDVFRLCKAALDGSAIDAKYDAAYQNGYHKGKAEAEKNWVKKLNIMSGIINSLFEQLEDMTDERDAAVADVKKAATYPCHFCKKSYALLRLLDST